MLPLLVIFAATTAAPDAAPTPAPSSLAVTPTPAHGEAPAKELEDLAGFAGRWTCETTPRAGEEPVRSEWTIERDLRGFWYAGRAIEQRTDGKPPQTRLFFWGHDAIVGKFVGGWVDSQGGWSAQTSVGWEREGDGPERVVFLGHVTVTGQKVMGREVLSRPEGGEFVWRSEVLDHIEWKRVSEERCRRAPHP